MNATLLLRQAELILQDVLGKKGLRRDPRIHFATAKQRSTLLVRFQDQR
jgi:hypothetical protein